jgi:hypothetical protein
MEQISRRKFVTLCCAAAAARRDRIVDVHQHTVYGQRDGEQLVLHQRAMGVTMTVLAAGWRAASSVRTSRRLNRAGMSRESQ